MYEFTCEYCGKVNQVEHKWQIQRFCNKSCACSYGNKIRAGIEVKRPVRTPVETPVEIPAEFQQQRGECVFQPGAIECYKRDCLNCGWNPVVAKARLEKFLGVDNHADQML